MGGAEVSPNRQVDYLVARRVYPERSCKRSWHSEQHGDACDRLNWGNCDLELLRRDGKGGARIRWHCSAKLRDPLLSNSIKQGRGVDSAVTEPVS